MTTTQTLRPPAEQAFAEELHELSRQDSHPRPPNWKLSPRAVMTYVLGGELPNGFKVSAKYMGNRRVIEQAVATLTTDRALLLYGVPGTAKSVVSEHLTAAISGDSTLLVQGTAGTSEEQLRYSLNYASLLTKGPSPEAIVDSPIMTAMKRGSIARIEELTRIPSDVQDTLITALSEKTIPVPGFDMEVRAERGFNAIATANNKDKGVNELSAALTRRFTTVILPLPATEDEEVRIVQLRVQQIGRALDLPAEMPVDKEIRRVVRIFRELRSGQANEGRITVKTPSGSLSTAEAIDVFINGMALAGHFGDGQVKAPDIAAGLTSTVVRDPVQDAVVWGDYLKTVLSERGDCRDLHRACTQLL